MSPVDFFRHPLYKGFSVGRSIQEVVVEGARAWETNPPNRGKGKIGNARAQGHYASARRPAHDAIQSLEAVALMLVGRSFDYVV
jgi:hypothetical protein